MGRTDMQRSHAGVTVEKVRPNPFTESARLAQESVPNKTWTGDYEAPHKSHRAHWRGRAGRVRRSGRLWKTSLVQPPALCCENFRYLIVG